MGQGGEGGKRAVFEWIEEGYLNKNLQYPASFQFTQLQGFKTLYLIHLNKPCYRPNNIQVLYCRNKLNVKTYQVPKVLDKVFKIILVILWRKKLR